MKRGRGTNRSRGLAPLKIVFGDPILPPPESEASEAAYEKLTAELRARVVGMWEQLRGRISARRISFLLRPRMRLVVNLQHMLHRQLRIALRGSEAFVAEQFLNGAQVGAFFQHVRAESMAQRVRMHVRRKTFGDGNLLDDAADAARGEPAAAPVDEQRRRVLAAFRKNFLAFGKIGRQRASLLNRQTEHSVLFFPLPRIRMASALSRMSSRLIPVSSELRMPQP